MGCRQLGRRAARVGVVMRDLLWVILMIAAIVLIVILIAEHV